MSLAFVIRIPQVLPHKNADNLEIVPIGGTRQTITTKGQFQPGELGILILPGAIVQQTEAFGWLWEGHRKWFRQSKRLTIGVRKYRGQYSHALLMHPNELGLHAAEGADVSNYVLQEPYNDEIEGTLDLFGSGWGNPRCKRQHMPRSLKGWIRFLFHRYRAA
jgi:hypothetical protein